MQTNVVLALYSDYAFRTAVVLYLAVMVLHLAEYAGTRKLSRVREPQEAVAVGAGEGGATVTDRPDAATPREWPARLGRMAVALTILGAAVHAASLVLRGLAVVRWPWGNMYEFISAICLAAVVTWLVMLRRSPGLRVIGAFVLLPVEILLFLAGSSLYVKAAPVMPALQSYWLAIHVSTVAISSGLLMVTGVASILFLLRKRVSAPGGVPVGRQTGRPTEAGFAGVLALLPTSDALDRLAYRITVFAFPLYTFAIIAGAIWAESAWGRFWGWDPKETVALVVWVAYACYLHARSTAGWRTGGAAWINVVGFAAILFNLFFVNLVTAGLHSYAGL
ncbi:cytochrome c-type biogenesis protein CcsB [Pseudonocardia eucalypti]|nr:cytochrome c-type biogenesis protein CcsB [Pseudonocardia eucalypti]